MLNAAALRQGVGVGSNRMDRLRHALPNHQTHENAQAKDRRARKRHARNRLTQRLIADCGGLADHHGPPDRHPLPGGDHRSTAISRDPDRALQRALKQCTAQVAGQQRVEVALQIGGARNNQHLPVKHQCRRALLQPTGDHPRKTRCVESTIEDPPHHILTQHGYRNRHTERSVRASVDI